MKLLVKWHIKILILSVSIFTGSTVKAVQIEATELAAVPNITISPQINSVLEFTRVNIQNSEKVKFAYDGAEILDANERTEFFNYQVRVISVLLGARNPISEISDWDWAVAHSDLLRCRNEEPNYTACYLGPINIFISYDPGSPSYAPTPISVSWRYNTF